MKGGGAEGGWGEVGRGGRVNGVSEEVVIAPLPTPHAPRPTPHAPLPAAHCSHLLATRYSLQFRLSCCSFSLA